MHFTCFQAEKLHYQKSPHVRWPANMNHLSILSAIWMPMLRAACPNKCKGNSAWYCTDTLAFVCFACCLLGFVSISSGLPKGIWFSSFIFRVYSSNLAGDAFYILIEGQVRLQLDVKIFAEALTSSRTWIIWIRSVSSLMVGRWPNWRQHRKNHPFLVLPPEDLHEFSSMFQHVAVLHQWLSKSLVENHW